MDKALDLKIRGREFQSRYGQEFFILKFSVFAPSSPSKPMQIKSTVTYSELIPCFRKRFAKKKIWLPFPAVYNFSCQL